MTKILVGIIISVMVFFAGYFTRAKTERQIVKEIPIIKTVKVIESKVVDRMYPTLPNEELASLLIHYDRDPFFQTYKFKDDNTISINTILFQRSDTREVTLKYRCGSSGNWEFYIGGGIVVLLAGSYVGWQAYKHFH